MEREEFEQAVADALESVPERFRDAIANVAIVVEDEPSPSLLRKVGVRPPSTLFGLYQGVPLTSRSWDYGNALPDQILLFQGPHERHASSHDDLIASIGETLIHELGHYFGLSEREIMHIEKNYWRKRGRR